MSLFIRYFLLLLLCKMSSAEEHKATTNIEKMKQDQVIPDVIDNIPKAVLSVKFGKYVVELGNELTPTQVKDEPEVEWKSENNTFYTLAMVDPDAPSRTDPKFREFNHWLVANIPGNKIADGDIVAAFLGSGPPKGTGKHRYVFLLYKQPKKLNIDDEPKATHYNRQNRASFKIRKFAQKYNLGEPIAGNFYSAQWDPYVDERNKNVTQ